MTIKVQYTAQHGEIMQPGNVAFSIVTRMLGRLPVEVSSLSRIDSEGLKGCDALLIGNPTRPFSIREVRAVQRWLRDGGRVLALSSWGGSHAANGRRDASNSLSEIFDVTFADECVGEMGQREGRRGFDSHTSTATGLPGSEADPLIAMEACSIVTDGDELWIVEFTADAVALQALRRQDGRLHTPNPTPSRPSGVAAAGLRRDQGLVICCGTTEAFSDDGFKAAPANIRFAQRLLSEWLPDLEVTEIARRKGDPQRHRLLNAFPMRALMYSKEDRRYALGAPEVEIVERGFAARDPSRRVLVGVLPHPMCNPTVRGCGYCTFPHQAYRRSAARAVTEEVAREIEDRLEHFANLRSAGCDVVYFGGATANLATPAGIGRIWDLLRTNMDCSSAEVTIEGVPIYFLRGTGPALLELVADTGRGRISMGVQTFDRAWLRRMGREHFGGPEEITDVNRIAHELDLRTSCDMLIDLPGQTLPQILEDLDRAIGSGFDQVCAYHLVLFEGLGTEWSKDPAMLEGLPSNEEAAERWSVVREFMADRGFSQTTLTNFERQEVIEEGRNFIYEPWEMNLHDHDFIGFGPAAITRISPPSLTHGLKFANPEQSADYLARMKRTRNGLPWERFFEYEQRDMEILYLTRHIGRGRIDMEGFRRHFGRPVEAAFPRLWPRLLVEGWIAEDGCLTSRGNTYADSFAGSLAWPRTIELEALDSLRLVTRRGEGLYENSAAGRHMG